ncbi:MAG: zf-HC2 domain-containing protein, partial [Bacteroidales bacterium]|nr:zf-HC2 domain-containing protein [Bacteroidales bacterium]
NCKEVNKNLIFYINGELQSEKETELQEHFKDCHDCNVLFLNLKETMATITEEKAAIPNPFLFTRIQEEISNLEKPGKLFVLKPNFIKILQPVTLSLLLLTGVIFGITMGNSIQYQTPEQSMVYQSDEFYLNDLQQETIESFLLTEE